MPRYIKVTRPVLEIFKMAGYFPDSHHINYFLYDGFGGLGVACWPLIPKFAGSNPTEAVGFLGRKNLQHAFLRRGSKAVGPMS